MCIDNPERWVRSDELRPNRGFYLDLGEVAVIAEVSVNGRALGTRWKPSFRYDVISAIQSGPTILPSRLRISSRIG